MGSRGARSCFHFLIALSIFFPPSPISAQSPQLAAGCGTPFPGCPIVPPRLPEEQRNPPTSSSAQAPSQTCLLHTISSLPRLLHPKNAQCQLGIEQCSVTAAERPGETPDPDAGRASPCSCCPPKPSHQPDSGLCCWRSPPKTSPPGLPSACWPQPCPGLVSAPSRLWSSWCLLLIILFSLWGQYL